MASEVIFQGLPGESTHAADSMVFKTRVNTAWQHYLSRVGDGPLPLRVSVGTEATPGGVAINESTGHLVGSSQPTSPALDKRAETYVAKEPLFRFDQLVVPGTVREQLILAARIIDLESLVFDAWGLRKIEPFPRSALNFYGPPGTGKTLAAHALASHLGRKILLASYGQIESMYHGEGPKNVEAVFHAAQRDNALLFIDEADSLLSRRLTSVTQGSEQAINSMRSQLLMSLDQFRGVVVFATNLIENYDVAFETRVRNLEFLLPDRPSRERIWSAHLPPEMPLADDVTTEKLGRIEDLCGREIRNAVIEAALRAAMDGSHSIDFQDFLDATERVKESRVNREKGTVVRQLSDAEQREFDQALKG